MVLQNKMFQKARRAILTAIAYVLPSHSRRLVLWSTLYGLICNKREVTTTTAAELNDLLGLAKCDQATALPIRLGSVIWADLSKCLQAISDAMHGKNVAECADDFIASVPKWLRYASERYIREDFERIVRAHHCPVFTATA